MLEGIPGTVSLLDTVFLAENLLLKTGQVLRARVEEVQREEAVLLLAGRRVRVRARAPLARGEELLLVVQGRTAGGSVVLRILPQIPEGEAGRRSLLAKTAARRSGPELKPFLLALARALGREGFSNLPQQVRELTELLAGLELLREEGRAPGTGNLHLVGWISLAREDAPFSLSVREFTGGVRGEGEKGLELLLYTVTPHLGPLLVELRCRGNWLTCALTAAETVTRDLWEGCQGELRERLSGLPWQVQVLPCRLEGRREVEETWLRQLMCRAARQVDIRV